MSFKNSSRPGYTWVKHSGSLPLGIHEKWFLKKQDGGTLGAIAIEDDSNGRNGFEITLYHGSNSGEPDEGVDYASTFSKAKRKLEKWMHSEAIDHF